MKKIFLIYWIWHSIILTVQFIDPKASMFFVKSFICFSYASLFYISIAPFIHLSTATRGTQSDLKYMYACMATIITRFTIIMIGIAFGENIYGMLAFDLFTIVVYFSIKWKLSSFSEHKLFNAINQHD